MVYPTAAKFEEHMGAMTCEADEDAAFVRRSAEVFASAVGLPLWEPGVPRYTKRVVRDVNATAKDANDVNDVNDEDAPSASAGALSLSTASAVALGSMRPYDSNTFRPFASYRQHVKPNSSSRSAVFGTSTKSTKATTGAADQI